MPKLATFRTRAWDFGDKRYYHYSTQKLQFFDRGEDLYLVVLETTHCLAQRDGGIIGSKHIESHGW
jgi:hypothetical protein